MKCSTRHLENLVSGAEKHTGRQVKIYRTPFLEDLLKEDNTALLDEASISLYRSLLSLLLRGYQHTVKTLASKMSRSCT